MKTIDDAVRELEGKWPFINAEFLRLDSRTDGIWFSVPSRLVDQSGRWSNVCTRAEFDRRAAEMGYWLEWDASETSECPVDPSVKVEVEYRDGIKESGYAREFSWDFCDCGTITRYRVVQPAKAEQFEVMWGGDWVNAELIGTYDGEEVYGINAHLDEGGTVAMAVLRSQSSGVRTRPSERERWIEAARKASESRPEVETYDAIYDAGLAKVE